MAKKDPKNQKKDSDPQDIINTAAGAAGGIPKPVIDAGTKPKPKKPPKVDPPEPPEPGIAGGTPNIGKKKQ